MIITSVSNPVYSTADHSAIDCLVTFTNDNGTPFCKPNGQPWGPLPYTAAAHDGEAHGIQLWADLQAGIHGEIAPYSPTTS